MVFILGFLVPVLAFAQEVIVPPSQAEIVALLQSVGGLKGASSLAVVAFIVQALMLFAKSKLAGFLGKYQLLAVMALTLVGGVVALAVQGISIGAALVHSSSLAAAQVLAFQIFKQFIEKKA